ncbi:ethionine resistance-conferring protein 1 [Acrodontium crateriforme]|uniref:Ethionine resistance-conferring protein 1 n=1 Tax=Acrodontium crateriforme TaxID=150365 RepID=A0AAQ3RBU1_9PEZI|nr:ethionine resistance-conferring protein 1 [Acrodontium crateriforme]
MSTSPRPIANGTENQVFASLSRSMSRSWAAGPLVQASLDRDQEASAGVVDDSEDETTEDEFRTHLAASAPTSAEDYSLARSYRRASFATAGNRATYNPTSSAQKDRISREDRKRAVDEERSLLRDNNLILPKHPHTGDDGPNRRKSSLGKILSIPGGDVSATASETTALLGDPTQPYGGQDDPRTIKRKWQEAVKGGKIQTTWQREAKTLATYSFPLMATFLLQYSLTVASIFTVGHIGTVELGAVSLASMTANITGYAIYQGLATSLDTLCAQAYGSGRKKLVGLQMQRMTLFLWTITIPIGIVWLLADRILLVILPEPAVSKLAGLYLKVVLAGAPGYAAFEAGKRFVQAQGLFSASLHVLMILAPLNAFMNWFFVWKLKLGFVGAPIAVAITDTLLPIGLFIYVRFVSKRAMSCWNGFTRLAWHNWGPMIKLALPGVIMIEAEVLAFEILTFAASYFGVEVLAAQSVLATITSITFQIPFPLSIAASTRVANLIGATLANAAKLTTKVAFVGAVIIGVLNVTLLSALRTYIPQLFTSDPEVIKIVSDILPLCAAFQLFDALAALCNGTLRGLGRQHFGGYVQLFCYYLIAMPLSMGTAFGLHWGLWGLWTGVALALGLVAIIEFIYLYKTDWQRSVEEARQRNAMDG